jgi:hypothetical protein
MFLSHVMIILAKLSHCKQTLIKICGEIIELTNGNVCLQDPSDQRYSKCWPIWARMTTSSPPSPPPIRAGLPPVPRGARTPLAPPDRVGLMWMTWVGMTGEVESELSPLETPPNITNCSLHSVFLNPRLYLDFIYCI